MRIILTGKNSYIGRNTRDYLISHGYEAECVSVREDVSFKGADVVVHCAAIVHKREGEYRDEYENVNFLLTKKLADKAKAEGVSQFIFMSTMAVYGVAEGEINENTPTEPKTLYGKSKLKAEKYVMSLNCDSFKTAVIRPPMVYGPKCPGNFERLKKIAEITPLIPDTGNRKSLIYMGNLAYFIGDIIKNKKDGIYMPMDGEYVSTAKLMKYISHKPVSKILGMVKLLPLGVVKKAFGTLYYSESIAQKINYVSVEEAVRSSVK